MSTEQFHLDPDDGQVITQRANGRRRVQTQNLSDSRTVQSDVNQAEIKNILANYEATGIMQHMRDVDLQFRDVTEFNDLADAMQQAKEAESVFLTLPPKLREVFNNDVADWLDAAHDPAKIESLRPQLEELGVLEPLPTPEPAAPAAPVAPPAPPPPSE